jgi:hypothetical protein
VLEAVRIREADEACTNVGHNLGLLNSLFPRFGRTVAPGSR